MTFKVEKELLLWMIMFLILLRPVGLVNVLHMSEASRIFQFIVVIIVVLYCIKKELSLSLTNKIYIGYMLWLFVVSLVNFDNNSLSEYCTLMSVNLCVVFFISYILSKDTNMALRAMMYVYYLLLLVNLFLMIVFPHGIYNLEMYEKYARGNWLVGHVNVTITYVLPAICVSLLYSQTIKKGKHQFIPYSLIAIAIANVLVSRSMTAIVSLILFALILFCLKAGRGLQILNLKVCLIISSFIFVAIVLFNVQDLYSDFFVKYFNRSTSFTGRTIIWNRALQELKNCYVWGKGYHVSAYWLSYVKGPTAHNEYLFCLLQGGLILLILFYGIFISVSKVVDKNLNLFTSQLFVALVFSQFLIFITEANMHRISVLIALIGNANLFVEMEKGIMECGGS